jgi:hypothetical protein
LLDSWPFYHRADPCPGYQKGDSVGNLVGHSLNRHADALRSGDQLDDAHQHGFPADMFGFGRREHRLTTSAGQTFSMTG